MQYSVRLTLIVLSLSSPLVYADVVMDMVTRDAAGQEKVRTKVYARSKTIRMDQGDTGAGVGDSAIESDNSMLFLGTEFVYINHKDRSYIVMDEAMLDKVSAQISDAMKEMEAQLANMPPEQRAMVEQMMKGRMQGMMDQNDESEPPPRVEEIGSAKWNSYKCREYAVFEGEQKVQEVCAAKLDDVDGGDEVMEAFVTMAAYIKKMTESMPMMNNDGLNPGELMEQIDGFPVHTVDYLNGQVVSEMSLDSVIEQDLDPDMFTVPKGYRRDDPFAGR
ncbi:MAG: DUF4412 domain-containing protein [Gammaproteobacteria bacterium]